VLRWILKAVAEPGVRADLLDELDIERERLNGESGPDSAVGGIEPSSLRPSGRWCAVALTFSLPPSVSGERRP
jgi:hypothetical protein